MVRDIKYWKTLLEGDEVTQEEEEEKSVSPTEYLPEIIYPFELTDKLLQLYRDPVYNRETLGSSYPEVILKILRSAKYWRIDIPKWLVSRVKSLR